MSVGRAGAIIAAGTLVSRVLGLFRAMVLAFAIGSTGLAANAFSTSIKIPNTVYTLIITGALTAVLVPQITKAALARDGGQKYINKLVSLTIVGSAALLPVLALATPWLIALLGAGWNDSQQTRLATLFAFWLLPQVLFYSLYTVVGEVLNAKSVFGPYAWSPVLNNVISIAGLLAFVYIYSADPGGSMLVDRWDFTAIALVAGSATVGVAVQGLVLFAFWRKAKLRFRFDLRFRGIGLGTMGKVAFWTFLSVLMAQLIGFVFTAVLNTAQADEAGLAAYELAHLISVLPHSIFTISLVTANFTRMSDSVHAGNIDQMKKYLGVATRYTAVIMVYMAAAMAVLAVPLVRIIQPAAPRPVIDIMATLLLFTALGIVQYSLLFVFNRGFFSMSDTKTPFLIAAWFSAVSLAVAFFATKLETAHVAYALTIATGILTAFQAIVTFLKLRKNIGNLDGTNSFIAIVQAVFAGTVAAGAGFIVLNLIGGTGEGAFAASSFVGAFVASAVVATVMAVVYVLSLLGVKNRDVKELTRQFAARFLRR